MRACPRCGEQDLPLRSRFCLSCGETLPAAEARQDSYTPPHLARDGLTSATALGGERKEVSILFADIAASLAMSEALDPEDVHGIMDGFFSLALDAVHAQRGTINQFRGDGFMALFGAPVAQGNDAVRSLRAALRIRELTAGYSRTAEARYGLPLALRIAIHTGIVWVGSIGSDLRRDYTAEGATVGTTARLQELAEPGQILVTEQTAKRAQPFFEFRELGERRLRGVSTAIRVFELVGAEPYEARLDFERARGWSPFVGRETELVWLASLGPGPSGAPPALIEICGEAGIGKSRLALEYLRQQSGRLSVLETRCRELDVSRAYAPWLELLRAWPAALPGAKDAEALLPQLQGQVESRLTRPEVALRLSELLSRAARDKPLIVLLEDGHWLDPSSRETLELLCSKPAEGRFSVLATVRSEAALSWPGSVRVNQLHLGPLESAACEQIAAGMLNEVATPAPLIDLAVHRSGGNPLFVEEVARALGEGPEELRRAARLESALLRAPIRVPATLRATIASRIDSLSDLAKRLLQAAAVIELPFDLALLRAVAGEGGRDIHSRVSELVERGLLTRTDRHRFEFRHVLVREVACEQIVLSRRRELHLRCAEALATRGPVAGPADASRIGWHYDRGGDALGAAEYLARAGSGFVGLYAAREAVEHLQRAWELRRDVLPPDPAARVSVGLSLVTALNVLDRAHDSAVVLDALQREPLDPSHREQVGRVCVESGWVRFSERNRVEEGRDLRGLELIRASDAAPAVAGTAYLYLSRINAQDGDVARAVADAKALIDLADRERIPIFRILGLATQAYALCDAGEIEDACRLSETAAREADQSENDVAVAIAYAFDAKVRSFSGEGEAALASAARGRAAAERAQQLGSAHIAAAWAAHTQLLLGRPDLAMAELEGAAAGARWPAALELRACILLALGRFQEAAEDAHECIALEPPRLTKIRALRSLGLALELSEPAGSGGAAGEELIVESLQLSDGLGLRPHVAEAREALGRLSLSRGDRPRARQHFIAAANRFEACGMRLHARLARAAARECDAEV
jgi:class 3 adenylate cyclase/tetratricopeptide (TPR) repeat protein